MRTEQTKQKMTATETTQSSRPRVVHVVTSSVTTRLMLGQLSALREAGYDVYLVSNPGPELELVAAQERVTGIGLPMEREISLRQDARSLWRLWRTFRQIRPDLVNAGTAKAGLLAGLAAVAAGVPCRVYTVHGLRLETLRGLKRRVLVGAERLSCRVAHRVLCVSESVRGRMVEFGLTDRACTCLLGAGSFNGINYPRFSPSPERRAAAAKLRAHLGIPAAAPVIGFVGRMTRDKGIAELVGAYQRLQLYFPELRLLLLGKYEEADPVPLAIREAIESDPHIHFVGYVSDPAPYYHVMDVFALPTYREGFPTVGLEAASAGKPVVSTFATGAVDAVVDGVTGLLAPIGDVSAFADALRRVLEDQALAARMGQAARARVEQDFQRERVWVDLVALYRQLLDAQGVVSEEDPSRLLPRPARGSRWALAAKRGADLLGAALGLILAAPLMGLAALAIRLTMGSPVLFTQVRTGRGARLFTLYKFRTMNEAREEDGRLRPDATRLTPVGRFLRRLSIDELPQLWNVLKGEMSLVGPRPLLPEYLPAYSPRERLRHRVKPGVTGLVQVNGRRRLYFSQRLEMDSWYAEHWSLGLDLRLLALTLPRTLSSRGAEAYQEKTIDDRGFWRYLEHLTPGHGDAADPAEGASERPRQRGVG